LRAGRALRAFSASVQLKSECLHSRLQTYREPPNCLSNSKI
jgi:hypothetical protein